MFDCDWSIIQEIELNYSNPSNFTNESVVSLIKLEIDIDKESIFNPDLSFNQPLFWIGAAIIFIISFIISCYYAYCGIPRINRIYKLKKLKSLNINPYSKKEINPCLDKHTDNVQDINETVFDFANIQSKSLNSILHSQIDKQPLFCYFIKYMFISTLLIASYYQFYSVISHWSDSYKSWIETKCYPYIEKQYETQYHYLQVDMNNLNYPCGDDYIFYLDIDFMDLRLYQP